MSPTKQWKLVLHIWGCGGRAPLEIEGGVISVLVLEAIEALPLANTPEVFGLHSNAEIGYYTQAARDMWTHLLELQPQTGRVGCGD